MSTAKTSLPRTKGLNHRALSMFIGQQAYLQHEEGTQYAIDMLQANLDDHREDAKRSHITIALREGPSDEGIHTLVSYMESAPGEVPIYFGDIHILTGPDDLQCTDSAKATPVSFSTHVWTIITEEDGMKFKTPLWRKTFTEIVT